MAFIHFHITQGSEKSKFSCMLDGFRPICFKDGEYAEIADGHHVIAFDGAYNNWHIQESLSANDCVEITLIVSYDGVVGSPEYEVVTLSDEQAAEIHQQLSITQEIQAKKFNKGKNIVSFVVLSQITLLSLVIFFAGFAVDGEEGLYLTVGGLICLAVGIAGWIFKFKKRS